jgi:tetratricopeptide (TPR) repeat protein
MERTRVLKFFILFLTLSFFSCWNLPCLVCAPEKNSSEETAGCAYSHFLNAELERLKGSSEEAIREYEKAIECDPSSFYLRKKLIVFLATLNKIDSAKDLVEETAQLFPDRSDVALVLSQLYRSEGESEKAMRILQRIIEKDPENQRACFLLFSVFLDKKRWSEAEEYARILIEMAEQDEAGKLEEIYAQIGAEYAGAERFDKALEYIKKACEVEPGSLRNRLFLGALYEEKSAFEDALREYYKALSLSPFTIVIYYRLGEVYTQLGRTDEAISMYEKALQINNNDYVSATSLARLYYDKGDYEEGLTVLEDFPIKDSYIFYLTGTFLSHLEKWDEAEKTLEKAIELAPDFYAPYVFLIHVYGVQERKEEALSLLSKAKEELLLPKEQIYRLLGTAYSQFEDWEEAIYYLRQAHQLNLKDDHILFQLGAAYERNKNRFRAVYNLRKAISLNPQNAEALNYLGYMYAEEGKNLNEAVSMIKRALEIEPENGYFVDSLGWAYYQIGLLDEALEELKRAVELLKEESEDDPIIREHLGDVYYKKGDLEKAREHWEASRSLDSTREEVKKRLEKLKNILPNNSN